MLLQTRWETPSRVDDIRLLLDMLPIGTYYRNHIVTGR